MEAGTIGFRQAVLLRTPDDGDTTAGAGAVVRRSAVRVGRWVLRNWRDRQPDLNGFSDAQLRDIGLSRIDVEQLIAAIEASILIAASSRCRGRW